MQATVYRILRLLLGLFMVIIGLNKFLGFIEIPQPADDGGELMQVYMTSGFLQFVGVLQMLGGSALLVNRFVPLALTFLTAIMLNATIFHLLHDPLGSGPAALCLIACMVLVYDNRPIFSQLLSV